MAFELAVVGVVVGVVLGPRYQVLILVPAALFAVILAILIGVGRAGGLWSIVLTAVALVTAVQIGYLAVVVLHAPSRQFAGGATATPTQKPARPGSICGDWMVGRSADLL